MTSATLNISTVGTTASTNLTTAGINNLVDQNNNNTTQSTTWMWVAIILFIIIIIVIIAAAIYFYRSLEFYLPVNPSVQIVNTP